MLRGGDGADTLDGGGETDLLLGDAGADALRGGDDADLLFGEGDADLLEGGDGADTLDGGAGNDTLDGGAGADALFGGAGDDLFVLDGAGDLAFEGANGGGSDTVRAGASHRLNPGIEVLVLTGAADLQGFGNAGANRITGNAGGNRLAGGAGGDTLDGAAGRDTLYGGEGDDVFHVQGAEDTVVEWSGQGRDTVVADSGAAGYALPAHVEALVLAGATAHGTGNGLANRMAGNGLGNTLRAGAGDDTLLGGGGDDALHGEAGADLFVFDPGMGRDRIADFQPGIDRLLLRGLGVASFAQLLAATADGGEGAVIEFGDGQRLVLQGVSEARLGAADALFG